MTRIYLCETHTGMSARWEQCGPEDMGATAFVEEGAGVRVKAEILAKEIQMIVAADRWKGRDLSAAPPEKWHRLRPETQQFWIDEAARILAALEPVAQPETPTPGQFTTMCLAIEDVVTGRGFDVDPWQSIETAPRDGSPFLTFSAYAADDPHKGALGITGTTMLVMAWLPGDERPYPVDEHGDWHDFHCFDHTHWTPLPKPPGETTSAILEAVKAYLRNVLMVGGWRGEVE